MKTITVLFSFALFVIRVAAQGSFQNLDFESATLPSVPRGQSGGSVSVNNALPGWQAYFGTNSISSVFHNDVSLGAVRISVFGPDYGSAIVEANYSVSLEAGFNNDPNVRDASIGQSGLVPSFAQSVLFKIGTSTAGVNFGAFLGGQPLNIVLVTVDPAFVQYGANIGSFAGSAAELRFTSFWTADRPLNPVVLDSIQFSDQPIPEPSAIGLFGLGSLFLGWRFLSKRP